MFLGEITPEVRAEMKAEFQRGMLQTINMVWNVKKWLTTTYRGLLCLIALCILIVLILPVIVQAHGGTADWTSAAIAAIILSGFGVRCYFLEKSFWDRD